MKFPRNFSYFVLFVSQSLLLTAPPPPALEIFNPTVRKHAIEAICVGKKLRMSWSFDGKNAKLVSFLYEKFTVTKKEIKNMNDILSPIDGDFFSWVECSENGAIISFIQANTAGTKNAKQIKFNFVNGKFVFIRRYNF